MYDLYRNFFRLVVTGLEDRRPNEDIDKNEK
jgi:hypothetical protein